jgi:hypothetical protein
MARQALTAFKRIMDARTGLFLHEFFVTFGAEVGIDSLQKVAFVRSMAIVTRDAIPPPYWRVYIALGKLVFLLRVTRVTNRIRPVDEHGASIRTMRIVAICAFLLLIGFVPIR